MNRSISATSALLCVFVSLGAASRAARADMAYIMVDNMDSLEDELSRAGHSALYFSTLCADGPVKLKRCENGEPAGVVVQRYPWAKPTLSPPPAQSRNYDWFAVPASVYFNGTLREEDAPLISSPKILKTLLATEYAPLFSTALSPSASAAWTNGVSERTVRDSYLGTITGTEASEAELMENFNTDPNVSKFNLLWNNCADFAKNIENKVLPEKITRGISGLGMTTPKGVMAGLVRIAGQHPELQFSLTQRAQLPGSSHRGESVLYPLQNSYENFFFAPWLIPLKPIISAVAFLFYEVLDPFHLDDFHRAYLPGDTSELTNQEHALRLLDNELAGELKTPSADKASIAADRKVIDARLAQIPAERSAAQASMLGSNQEWSEFRGQFAAAIKQVQATAKLPAEVEKMLAGANGHGQLSARVFQLVDQEAEVQGDLSGVRLTVTFASDRRKRETGLSERALDEGDRLLAFLVLASVIDYNLNCDAKHREYWPDFTRHWTEFTTAAAALGGLS